MKTFLPIVLALACIALVVSVIVIKRGDDAQHESDTTSLADLSNQLTSAQSQLTSLDATVLTFSNSLTESQSATLSFSNHLTEAQSTAAHDAEQITALNQQVATMKSGNGTLGGQVTDLTNQLASLTQQLALTKASLEQTNQNLVQANKDYLLLENRFRIDVAERTVVERKFNNISALKAQLDYLRSTPTDEVTAESIYAGLNVEVKSNGWCHVIAPN